MTEERRDDVVYTAHETLSSTTFLEYAFLRWVLSPAVRPEIYRFITPQRELEVGGRSTSLTTRYQALRKPWRSNSTAMAPTAGG